jgi:hypothetical protein
MSENREKVCHVPTDIIGRAGGGLTGLVLVCLWSNPVISAVGCTPDMVASIAKYTGMAEPAVIDSITVLEQVGQIMVDRETNEALVPGWLDLNYLQDRSVAEKPIDVMSAIDAVKSARLKSVLLKDITILDVQYDAAVAAR